MIKQKSEIINTGILTIVKQDKKYMVTLGKFVIKDNLTTKEQAERVVKKPTWETIINVISAVNAAIAEYNKQEIAKDYETTNKETEENH